MEVTALPIHKRIFEILKAAGKEFGVDHAGRLGAALSYYTIFSLVPLLFLLVAIAGFVLSDPGAVNDLVDQVTEVAGAEVGDTISEILETVKDQRGSALSIGLLLAAFSASGIFLQVQGVLGALFHIPDERKRKGPVGWLIKRSIALVSAIIIATLAFIPILAVGAVGWMVSLLPERLEWLSPILQLGVPLVSLVLLMAVVGLTFQGLTVIEIPWKAAMRGGMATAAAGLIAAFLVGIYLTRAGSTGTLGALGGLAVLLFFFSLMWTVYLFGAEVTKVYADYLEYGDIVQPSLRQNRRSSADDSMPPMAPASVPAGRAATRRRTEPSLLAFVAGLAIGRFTRRNS